MKKPHLLPLLPILLALATGWSPGDAAAPPSRPPNVLVIVADDLGYADIGAFGCRDVPTPNVDSIVRNGVRFSNGYVSAPLCSPSRAGLLTGRYQQRFGYEFNPGGPGVGPDFGIPFNQPNFAERFRSLGYATGAVGKWHLGYTEAQSPLQRGFQEAFTFPDGFHSYLENRNPKNYITRNGVPVPQDQMTYTSDMFGDEAVAFIQRHKAEPWFLYLAFNAVHTPMQAPEKYLARFPDIHDPLRQKLAAMLSALDDNAGKALAAVREAGLEKNTLVIFLSDNGGPTGANGSLNTPLRGFKGQVFEGGIRTPMAISWPGHLPAGTVYDRPILSLDFLPTALAAVGHSAAPEEKLDGVDLAPYLAGTQAGDPHAYLYWRMGAQWAVRSGDWKLTKPLRDNTPHLFNLAEDIGEQHDLTDQNPDKAAALRAAWEAWSGQLQEPRWTNPIARREGTPAGEKAAQESE